MAVGNRETRLKSIIGYAGDGKDACAQAKSGCLKNAERTFTQTFQCQQMIAIITLLSIKDAVLVEHAPIGCSGCAAFCNMIYKGGQKLAKEPVPKNAVWVSTNLDENDIIHGAEEKLRQALLQVDAKHNPSIIFVLSSCASGIIGDDIPGTVEQLRNSVRAKLVPIACEGFKSKISATGYDVCYDAILDHLLEPSTEKVPELLNVISPFSMNLKDRKEIERLLSRLGIRPNFLPSFADISTLRQVTRAAASVSMCYVHADYFLSEFEKRYGIPYSKELTPLGVAATDRWLLGVADLFGKRDAAQQLIEEEHEQIRPRMEAIRKVLKGKRVFISLGSARGIAASEIAYEFGFELLGTHVFHFDVTLSAALESSLEKHGNFQFNVANMQPFEQANILERIKPDLFIGGNLWNARQGTNAVQIVDFGKNSFGYNGIVTLGEKLADAVSNPSFTRKLSQHASLPYKKSWYAQDPYKHLKSEEPVLG